MVTTAGRRDADGAGGDVAPWLRRLVCDNDGLMVYWPAAARPARLRVMLDGQTASSPSSSSARGVELRVPRWTLPYVSAARTTTTTTTWNERQSQPVVSASLPVYSRQSRRSR